MFLIDSVQFFLNYRSYVEILLLALEDARCPQPVTFTYLRFRLLVS